MASVTPPVWPTRSNMTWPTTASPPVCEDSWRCWTTRSSASAWSSPTEVPEPIAGRGIAGELTRVALRFAREQKYKVVPACSYAEAFLQRHEEYHDLLAG